MVQQLGNLYDWQIRFDLFDSTFDLRLDADSVDLIWPQIKLLKVPFVQAYNLRFFYFFYFIIFDLLEAGAKKAKLLRSNGIYRG